MISRECNKKKKRKVKNVLCRVIVGNKRPDFGFANAIAIPGVAA